MNKKVKILLAVLVSILLIVMIQRTTKNAEVTECKQDTTMVKCDTPCTQKTDTLKK